jgi:HAD superfamily hydrolase (TIGR01490 family)
MKTAAFFDLDGTLLGVNSGALWIERERRLGRISWRQVVEATVMLLAYRLSVVDMDAAMRKALAVYQGEREENLNEWTRHWYQHEIAAHVQPGARRALAEHRRQGHLLVLLTSSSPYLSAMVQEDLQLDDGLSTIYEVRQGLLTGAPTLPLCYGAGKISHAEKFARSHGVALDQSYFYTDSFTDLPMLLRVGRPRVVNPDLRLKLYARWRGWPVEDWQSDSPGMTADHA